VYANEVATGDVRNKRSEVRQRKMTPSCERVIRRIIKTHRMLSIPELTVLYNSGRSSKDTISTRTMRRTLKYMNIRKKPAVRKLQLSSVARAMRVQWCRKYSHMTSTQWSKVIFTDEVRIGLRNDGKINVWRGIGERFSPGCTSSTSTVRSSIVLWIYQPQWSRPSSPMHKQNVCE
jgi:hypothetical protein